MISRFVSHCGPDIEKRPRKPKKKSGPKREGISKSLRFRVFARDAFTCRYCGRKSDEVKLVIDHVIAVAKGGNNDEANLATSCEDCNSGKGVQSANPDSNNENVRLSRLQEQREQGEAAEAAIATAETALRLRQVFVNSWCEITGKNEVDRRTVAAVFSYVPEFGMEVVLRWVSLAFSRTTCDRDMGRYVSGIRRRELEARGVL